MIRAILFAVLTVGYFLGGYIAQPFHFFICLLLAIFTDSSYARKVFLAYDKQFNTNFGPIISFLLNNPIYKFGAEDETVSSAIGKNLRDRPNSSPIALWIIDACLTALDPRAKKSHCIESIQEDVGHG